MDICKATASAWHCGRGLAAQVCRCGRCRRHLEDSGQGAQQAFLLQSCQRGELSGPCSPQGAMAWASRCRHGRWDGQKSPVRDADPISVVPPRLLILITKRNRKKRKEKKKKRKTSTKPCRLVSGVGPAPLHWWKPQGSSGASPSPCTTQSLLSPF